MPKLIEIIKKNQLLSQSIIEEIINFSDAEIFNLLKTTIQIKEDELLKILATELNMQYKNLSDLLIDQNFLANFDLKICNKNRYLPIYQDESIKVFVFDNPYNPEIKNIKNTQKEKVEIILTPSQELNNYFGLNPRINSEHSVLDQLILTALTKKASDIHLKKEKNELKAYFRINGKIYPYTTFQGEEEKRLVNLIKINSKMNISIFNLPQDGRFSFSKDNKEYDIRTASLPTLFGESFVLRLFNSQNFSFALPDLGFSETSLKLIENIIKEPQGLVLVTGATGSGKTTTLYAILKELLKEKKKNIVSLEDPVEYILSGVSQSQINPVINYDFVDGLKAIMRQDPDVIMIGEIRDAKTAQVVLDAAYTGHLVLSTLHTANVNSTLLRLLGFNLDPFLLSYSLKGIISQRLLPVICPDCKTWIRDEQSPLENLFLPAGNLGDKSPKTPFGVQGQSHSGVQGAKPLEKPLPPQGCRGEVLPGFKGRSPLENYSSHGVKGDEVPFITAPGCVKCSFTGENGRTVLSEIIDLTKNRYSDLCNFEKLAKNNPFISFKSDLTTKTDLFSAKTILELNETL